MYGILIVDDNSLVRMSLVNLISWKQHNATLVAIAHDGNEAFRLCEERLPHIVITDIKMPGCDGITLMQKIHRYYPMIQVIAISAHGVFEYAKQAMQAGCLNYILKPISGEELNESIASAIAVIQSRGGRTDGGSVQLIRICLEQLSFFYRKILCGLFGRLGASDDRGDRKHLCDKVFGADIEGTHSILSNLLIDF